LKKHRSRFPAQPSAHKMSQAWKSGAATYGRRLVFQGNAERPAHRQPMRYPLAIAAYGSALIAQRIALILVIGTLGFVPPTETLRNNKFFRGIRTACRRLYIRDLAEITLEHDLHFSLGPTSQNFGDKGATGFEHVKSQLRCRLYQRNDAQVIGRLVSR